MRSILGLICTMKMASYWLITLAKLTLFSGWLSHKLLQARQYDNKDKEVNHLNFSINLFQYALLLGVIRFKKQIRLSLTRLRDRNSDHDISCLVVILRTIPIPGQRQISHVDYVGEIFLFKGAWSVTGFQIKSTKRKIAVYHVFRSCFHLV